MAFDLEQLQADARVAKKRASRYLERLERFENAKTEEGVDLTAEQRQAIKAAAAADAAVLLAAAKGLVAQHDANP